MKFGVELEGSLFPLWRSYYIDYEGLKDLMEELRDNFPYMQLFKTHSVHIDNDPNEPFKFLMSGVTFQFRDLDTSSKTLQTGTLKIVSVREKEETYQRRVYPERFALSSSTTSMTTGAAVASNNDGNLHHASPVSSSPPIDLHKTRFKDQTIQLFGDPDASDEEMDGDDDFHFDRNNAAGGGGGEEVPIADGATGNKKNNGGDNNDDEDEEEVVRTYEYMMRSSGGGGGSAKRGGDGQHQQPFSGGSSAVASVTSPMTLTHRRSGHPATKSSAGASLLTVSNGSEVGGAVGAESRETHRGVQPTRSTKRSTTPTPPPPSTSALGEADEDDDDGDIVDEMALGGTFVFDLCSTVTLTGAGAAGGARGSNRGGPPRSALSGFGTTPASQIPHHVGPTSSTPASPATLRGRVSNTSFGRRPAAGGDTASANTPTPTTTSESQPHHNSVAAHPQHHQHKDSALAATGGDTWLHHVLDAVGAINANQKANANATPTAAAAPTSIRHSTSSNSTSSSTFAPFDHNIATNASIAADPSFGAVTSSTTMTPQHSVAPPLRNEPFGDDGTTAPFASAAGPLGLDASSRNLNDSPSHSHSPDLPHMMMMGSDHSRPNILSTNTGSIPYNDDQGGGGGGGGGDPMLSLVDETAPFGTICGVPPPAGHAELFHIDPTNAALLRRCETTMIDPPSIGGKKKKKKDKKNKKRKDSVESGEEDDDKSIVRNLCHVAWCVPDKPATKESRMEEGLVGNEHADDKDNKSKKGYTNAAGTSSASGKKKEILVTFDSFGNTTTHKQQREPAAAAKLNARGDEEGGGPQSPLTLPPLNAPLNNGSMTNPFGTDLTTPEAANNIASSRTDLTTAAAGRGVVSAKIPYAPSAENLLLAGVNNASFYLPQHLLSKRSKKSAPNADNKPIGGHHPTASSGEPSPQVYGSFAGGIPITAAPSVGGANINATTTSASVAHQSAGGYNGSYGRPSPTTVGGADRANNNNNASFQARPSHSQLPSASAAAETFYNEVVLQMVDVDTVGYADPAMAGVLFGYAAVPPPPSARANRPTTLLASARRSKDAPHPHAPAVHPYLQQQQQRHRSGGGRKKGGAKTPPSVFLQQPATASSPVFAGPKAQPKSADEKPLDPPLAAGRGAPTGKDTHPPPLPPLSLSEQTPFTSTSDPFEAMRPMRINNGDNTPRVGAGRKRSNSAVMTRPLVMMEGGGGSTTDHPDGASDSPSPATALQQSSAAGEDDGTPQKGGGAVKGRRRSNSMIVVKCGGFGSVAPKPLHHQAQAGGPLTARSTTAAGGAPSDPSIQPAARKPTNTANQQPTTQPAHRHLSLFPYEQQRVVSRSDNTDAIAALRQYQHEHLPTTAGEEVTQPAADTEGNDLRSVAETARGSAGGRPNTNDGEASPEDPRHPHLRKAKGVIKRKSRSILEKGKVISPAPPKNNTAPATTVTLLAGRDHTMRRLQRIKMHQLQELYTIRLTMHIYVNMLHFGGGSGLTGGLSAKYKGDNGGNNTGGGGYTSGSDNEALLLEGTTRNAFGKNATNTATNMMMMLNGNGAINIDLNNLTPEQQQRLRTIGAIRYHNPAIAHALYAYQRSVSATIAAALQIEIEKASNFYLAQSHILCRAALLCMDSVKMWETLTQKERAQLRTVYRQTYLTLRILQQFCDLNILAIGKFLKKVDKNLLQNSLENYRQPVESLNFRMGHNSRITALQKLMVAKLARHTMSGSVKKAVKFLETIGDDERDFMNRASDGSVRFHQNKMGTLVSLAFLIGLVVMLGIMIILILAATGARKDTLFYTDAFSRPHAEYLLMVPIVFLLPQFLFSINVMIYERFGINYAFMFELDPIFHWTGAELMRDSLIYVLAWEVCAYVFLRDSYAEINCTNRGGTDNVHDGASYDNVPSVAVLWAIFPLFIVIWLLIAAYNKFVSVEQRPFWSAQVFWRIVTTPYYPVRFPDFFVLNYLTSMTTVLFEIQWYWCTFVASSPSECPAGRSMSLCILNSLPNIWRMVQSLKRFYSQPKATRKPFPNLVNAGKYGTGVLQPFVWTGWAIARYYNADSRAITTMYVLSFAAQILTQSYKYTWDVVVDAGIFIDYGNGGYEWRKERVYRDWWPYIMFMVVDFIFRWRWLVTYYVQLHYRPSWFFLMWSCVELIRRTFWSTFRVENEHVNNTEHYRATKLAPIPVKNIHAWDTFAPDASPEQFLAKNKRNQFSKEFPSIRGVNLSSVTRFFAFLPEEEKLNILESSPLCTGYTPDEDPNASAATTTNTLGKLVSSPATTGGGVGAAATTVPTAVGRTGVDYKLITPPNADDTAAVHDLNHTLNSSQRIGLGSKYISPGDGGINKNTNDHHPNQKSPPPPQQQQQKPKVGLDFKGKMGEGKSKFFSELPEEHKVIVIITHLGDETMNAFERRVTKEAADRAEKETRAQIIYDDERARSGEKENGTWVDGQVVAGDSSSPTAVVPAVIDPSALAPVIVVDDEPSVFENPAATTTTEIKKPTKQHSNKPRAPNA